MIDVPRAIAAPIPPEPTPSKLVTRKQAAEESGLSVSVIEKAIRAGRLKEVKGVGKRGASVIEAVGRAQLCLVPVRLGIYESPKVVYNRFAVRTFGVMQEVLADA
jgi:hypothetical protein